MIPKLAIRDNCPLTVFGRPVIGMRAFCIRGTDAAPYGFLRAFESRCNIKMPGREDRIEGVEACFDDIATKWL
jgi:hypothetical protein